jgi:hypothetical protein
MEILTNWVFWVILAAVAFILALIGYLTESMKAAKKGNVEEVKPEDKTNSVPVNNSVNSSADNSWNNNVKPSDQATAYNKMDDWTSMPTSTPSLNEVKVDSLNNGSSVPVTPAETLNEPVQTAAPVTPVENLNEPVQTVAPVTPVDTLNEPVQTAAPVTPVDTLNEPVQTAAPVTPVDTLNEPVQTAAPVTPVDTLNEPVQNNAESVKPQVPTDTDIWNS